MRSFLTATAITLSYLLMSRVGIELLNAFDFSGFWPASGMAMGLLIIFGRQYYWAILLASAIASLSSGLPIWISLSIAATHAWAAWVGATIFMRGRGQPQNFSQVRDIRQLILIAGVLSSSMAALLGSSILTLADMAGTDQYLASLLTWFLGDLSGIAVVAPIFLAWQKIEWPRISATRLLEGAVLLSAGLVTCFLVLGFSPFEVFNRQHLLFLPFPLLFWAAARFGIRGATLANLLLAGAVLLADIMELGPYGSNSGLFTGLWQAAYILIYSTTSLAIALVLRDSKRESDARKLFQERLDLALEAAKFGFWETSLKTNKVTLRGPWAELLGHSPNIESLEIGTWRTMIHPDDVAGYDQAMAAHLSGESELYSCEIRIPLNGGEWRWVLDQGRIIESRPGTANPKMTGLCVDISERKSASHALARSRQHLDLALDVGGLGIWEWDIEKQQVHYDRNWVKRIGAGTAAALLSIEDSLERFHPDDVAPYKQCIIAHLKGETDFFEYETRVITGESFPNWVCIRGRVTQRDTHGLALYAVGTVQDISHRKAAEDLERSMMGAQKLEGLGVLAGGIAHDFNNLLQGIIGHAELAMTGLAGHERARGDLDIILRSSQRAADLCHQLLAYSGKGKIIISPLSLTQLVREMGDLLEISVSRKARVRYDLTTEPTNVEADKAQISQLIMNLITNAAEAADSGGTKILVSTGSKHLNPEDTRAMDINASLEPGNYAYIEVSDNGCGMDKLTMSKIFDPFFSTKGKGRGLGMAALQGIVRGHDGAIQLQSVLGKGTTIRVYFPLSKNEQASMSAAAEFVNPDYVGSGTIMFVDDESVLRELGRNVLQSQGFKVITADNGESAFNTFKKERDRLCLIVMDLNMPILSGDDAMRGIRVLDPDIPVILCSGHNEQAINDSEALNISGFLHKPFKSIDLLSMVRIALEGTPHISTPKQG